MGRGVVVLLLAGLAGSASGEATRTGLSWDFSKGALRVSANRRYLAHADGTPFFWLADTAWELFHRSTREEAERYLESRRRQGFTVIQAVALAELDGLEVPNAYGQRPFLDNDPTRPDVKAGPGNDYWDHVDEVVRIAAMKGIAIGLLPTWGDKVGPLMEWGTGPLVFTIDNARVYGRWLGARYKDAPNLVWILGGDRPGDGPGAPVWRAMAKGITDGDEGRHLKTFHPIGGGSSALYFHDDEWLDFNMIQSGHGKRDEPNWAKVGTDYDREPAKPVVDGEPRYEDHPVNWDPGNGWFDDYDARQGAYWALFAGAFGHTYGCHDIWQMYAPGRKPVSSARTFWYEALELPGARQMLHVRSLMLSRPFLARVPDQTLLASPAGDGADHAQATRDADGSYAFVYLPTGRPVSVDLRKLRGPKLKAWWFDPRTGTATAAGEFGGDAPRAFDPPGEPGRGNDWVLVLDDASSGFPPPGQPR